MDVAESWGAPQTLQNAGAQKVRYCYDLTWHLASRAKANGHFINSDVRGRFHFHLPHPPTHTHWRVDTLNQERRHHAVSKKNDFNGDAMTVIKSEGGSRQEGKKKERVTKEKIITKGKEKTET